MASDVTYGSVVSAVHKFVVICTSAKAWWAAKAGEQPNALLLVYFLLFTKVVVSYLQVKEFTSIKNIKINVKDWLKSTGKCVLPHLPQRANTW